MEVSASKRIYMCSYFTLASSLEVQRPKLNTNIPFLQVKDIQENDAGWYQCQVLISITNKIAAEVELQVRRPPIISDNSTRSIVASEGESKF